MPTDEFDRNLLKFIAASVFASLSLEVAREMFGKSYFALGAGERISADQAAQAMLWGNINGLKPEIFAQGQNPSPAPAGFQPPAGTGKATRGPDQT
jgi:hypothetical protein